MVFVNWPNEEQQVRVLQQEMVYVDPMMVGVELSAEII